MRGHPYCLSCSLRIHSIFRAVRLCLLGRLAPRPAPRAVRRFVMPPFSPCVLLLVPSGVLLVSSPLVPPLSPPPLACLPRVPHRHGSSYRLPAPCSLSPRPSPRQSCRTSGETSPCLPLPCKAEAGGFSSSLVRGVSACLACGAVLI